MFYRIEPTGCCERKGNVQVRYCFYLEENDYEYEKHYVDVPIFPKDFDTEQKDVETAVKELPTEKQLNPFHNHFCYFNHDVTDEELQDKGKELLENCYNEWKADKRPNIQNPPIKVKEEKELCEAKVIHIKNIWQ